MPPQSTAQTNKLIAFVALVAVPLGAILAANVAIRDRTSSLFDEAGSARLRGLERLNRNPTRCGMTMRPSPDNERPMRHVNAGLIEPVDVLVLGQSDADHMSGTFFRDGVHFYNGFVSNSYYVLEYEVFVDLVAAHRAPRLVLLDIRHGFLLRGGLEPGWDSPPAGDPVWWGFPPFHLGKPAPRPWYQDIPSLLSLAQSHQTLTWLAHQLPRTPAPPRENDLEEDDGQQFRCVSLAQTSTMYRWLADGSRVYEGEKDGVFGAHLPVRAYDAVGERVINESRLVVLDWVIAQLQAAGSAVILYSPPVHPSIFDDKAQADAIHAAGRRFVELAARRNVDYCDLSDKADKIGCGLVEFSDELHISRACDRQVVRELARGCAPRAGPMLRDALKPEIYQ